MKLQIRINEYETYLINSPNENELSIQEATIFVDRLHKIIKAIGKDEIMEGIAKPREKRHYKVGSGKAIWSKDRNEAIKLLKLHYTASLDEKRAYAKEHNAEWDNLCARLWSLRKKWNIKPQEVGIKEFYKRGEFQPAFKKNNHKVYDKSNPRPFTKDREIALKVLYTHFWGTDEQKQAIANQYGVSWEKITKSITILRQKWKIEPKEVGLKEFPSRHNFGDFRRNKTKWRA
jgi:hypothetical protein